MFTRVNNCIARSAPLKLFMMCLTQAHFYLHTFAFYPDSLTANKSLLVAILFESKSLTRHFNNLSLNLTSRLVLNFRTVNFYYSQNTKYLQLKLQGLCNTLLSEYWTYETLKHFEISWHNSFILSKVFKIKQTGLSFPFRSQVWLSIKLKIWCLSL